MAGPFRLRWGGGSGSGKMDFWPGLIEMCEVKGWADGSVCAAFKPITEWGTVPEADDAYNTAYWHGLAYSHVPGQEIAGE